MHMSAASIHAKRGRRPNQLSAVRCAFNLLNFKRTRKTWVHASQRTVFLAFGPRRGQGDVDAGGESWREALAAADAAQHEPFHALSPYLRTI